MLHFRRFASSSKFFRAGRFFSTSSASAAYNPYYILGVEKDMTFDQIKKQYYKLAAEYHPDINKAPEAAKQFVTIKEAFETIKKWHGKSVKMDFEGGAGRTRSDFRSVRPDASQYTDEFYQEDERYARDESEYKEWAYKASQSEDHEKFTDSFETIHDIRDIKFRPMDVDVPDASKRFNLDDKKASIHKFSDHSGFFVVVVFGCFLLVFNYANKTENKAMDEEADNIIYNLKNKDEYQQLSLDEKENTVKTLSIDMRKQKEYVKFTGDFENKKMFEKSLRNKFVPEAQSYVSFNEVE